MTQAQRKQQHKIQLAPNQVYIKRPHCPYPVQTLVDGCPDWSYDEQVGTRCTTLAVYYKGRYVTDLTRTEEAFEAPCYTPEKQQPKRYETLTAFAQCYAREHPYSLEFLDGLNKQEGLEEWCLRQSFATTKMALRLTLPQQERQRFEQIAHAAYYDDLNEFALSLLYSSLPALEKIYHDKLNPGAKEAKGAGA